MLNEQSILWQHAIKLNFFVTLVSSEIPSPLAPKSSTSNTAAFPPPFCGGGVAGGGPSGGGKGAFGDGVLCLDLPALPLWWPEPWLLPFFFDSEAAVFRLRLQRLPTILALQISKSEHHTRSMMMIVNVMFLRQKPPIFSFSGGLAAAVEEAESGGAVVEGKRGDAL